MYELPLYIVQLGRLFYFLTVPSVSSCHKPLCHDQVHRQDTRLKANDSSKQTIAARCATKCTPIPSSLLGEVKTVHAHSFPNSSLLFLCHPSPSTMSPPCSTRSWLLKFGCTLVHCRVDDEPIRHVRLPATARTSTRRWRRNRCKCLVRRLFAPLEGVDDPRACVHKPLRRLDCSWSATE